MTLRDHDSLPFGPPMTAEEMRDLEDLARLRRGRRIVFEGGAFCFYDGERLVGSWRAGILDADPKFAHMALRWLLKGRLRGTKKNRDADAI